MNIELKEKEMVAHKTEYHYKIIVNGKEVWVNRWQNYDEFGMEGDTVIFKGEEKLTEEEKDEILNFMQEVE